MRRIFLSAALVCIIVIPFVLAANSPLLAWRDPIYIIAGFAGILAFALMLLQPLLAAGWLPFLDLAAGRRVHRWVGSVLILAVVIHVGALWITSPPDVIDALLFVSPTPFSNWGVIAMWAVFGAAFLALVRRPFHLRIATWRVGHTALVSTTVIGSILHAMLVDGTMETNSKAVLCAFILLATVGAVARLKVWAMMRRRRM